MESSGESELEIDCIIKLLLNTSLSVKLFYRRDLLDRKVLVKLLYSPKNVSSEDRITLNLSEN